MTVLIILLLWAGEPHTIVVSGFDTSFSTRDMCESVKTEQVEQLNRAGVSVTTAYCTIQRDI